MPAKFFMEASSSPEARFCFSAQVSSTGKQQTVQRQTKSKLPSIFVLKECDVRGKISATKTISPSELTIANNQECMTAIWETKLNNSRDSEKQG